MLVYYFGSIIAFLLYKCFQSLQSTVLNFIKRNLYEYSASIKATAYISLVYPMLKYASSAWDPHLLYSIDQIQCRATHWVLQNYNRYSSVTSMPQQLKWSTLQQHQQRSRLVLFYKAMQNTITLEIPHYYTTAHGPTRHHNHLSFIYPSSGTSVYMYSYFPRTIKEWNSLSEETVMADYLTTFCNYLKLLVS